MILLRIYPTLHNFCFFVDEPFIFHIFVIDEQFLLDPRICGFKSGRTIEIEIDYMVTRVSLFFPSHLGKVRSDNIRTQVGYEPTSGLLFNCSNCGHILKFGSRIIYLDTSSTKKAFFGVLYCKKTLHSKLIFRALKNRFWS